MPFTYQFPHPAVTVDACLFTIVNEQLEILLVKRGQEPFMGDWALPGGFVEIDEGLEAAVARELEEETGATGLHFEQLGAFGRVDRDPRERVISVAYLALARAGDVTLRAATDASEVAWFSVEDLPELAFDHADIVARAAERMHARI